MGIEAKKNAGIEIVGTGGPPNSMPSVSQPVFSSGELGQLQEILFGQQQRSTHEQIVLLREQFSDQLLCLSRELNNRLDQLTDSIEKHRQQVNQQVVDLNQTYQSELASVNKAISSVKTELQVDVLALSKSTGEESKRLDTKLAQHESALINEIEDTKRVLQAEITGSIDSLSSSKLDTQNLAQLLIDVSSKLTDPAKNTSK